MITFLHLSTPFPPIEESHRELGGLLAVGGDLSPQRLLDAYCRGIFPWGTLDGQPLWYAPDPRMALAPQALHISQSLRKTLRQAQYPVTLDTAFTEVIAACSETPRPGQNGTWISDEMQTAYNRLHELGWAHSVEVWNGRQLVGGLYGLAIGAMFFGESMFSLKSNASKIAFAHLCRFLSERGFGLIDCQMHTNHLATLGAAEMPRWQFIAQLSRLIEQDNSPQRWPQDGARGQWN